MLPIPDLLPDGIRPARFVDDDELSWLSDRQLLDDQTVEDREQGGVRANPERQRQHTDDGDDWGRRQPPDSVTRIDGEERVNRRWPR
jgi:hypothetical protein